MSVFPEEQIMANKIKQRRKDNEKDKTETSTVTTAEGSIYDSEIHVNSDVSERHTNSNSTVEKEDRSETSKKNDQKNGVDSSANKVKQPVMYLWKIKRIKLFVNTQLFANFILNFCHINTHTVSIQIIPNITFYHHKRAE